MSLPRLAFIGRQYHEKTKSDREIYSLLKQHFTPYMIRREQYTDQELVSAINEIQPDVVFFWCLPPSSTKHLWKIKCKNVVWAPMWDGFKPLGFRKKWLLERSKLKILCFSQALYQYFSRSKMPSLYVQCALKPEFTDLKDQGPYTLFFWQRDPSINLKTLVHFFGEKQIKKVIYKSEIGDEVDRSYSFEIEKLPNWLDEVDYEQKIKSCDYYVAPRKAEGIGFSFLEAMRFGKVILAYDESTMNEYVQPGENGYLFKENTPPIHNLKSPKALSEKMQYLAQHFYTRWQQDQKKIVPFILNTQK